MFRAAFLSAANLRSCLRFGTDCLTFNPTVPKGLLGRCLFQSQSTSEMTFIQQDFRQRSVKLYSIALSDLAGILQSDGDGEPGFFGALHPCGVGTPVQQSSEEALLVSVLSRRDRDRSASVNFFGSQRRLSPRCHRRVPARSSD